MAEHAQQVAAEAWQDAREKAEIEAKAMEIAARYAEERRLKQEKEAEEAVRREQEEKLEAQQQRELQVRQKLEKDMQERERAEKQRIERERKEKDRKDAELLAQGHGLSASEGNQHDAHRYVHILMTYCLCSFLVFNGFSDEVMNGLRGLWAGTHVSELADCPEHTLSFISAVFRTVLNFQVFTQRARRVIFFV